MTKIVFRQKTPEEAAADAAAKQKREATAVRAEERPAAAAPLADDAMPDTAPAFALDGEAEAPKAKKGRRR